MSLIHSYYRTPIFNPNVVGPLINTVWIVVRPCMLSFVKGHLPSKVVFHQRLPSSFGSFSFLGPGAIRSSLATSYDFWRRRSTTFDGRRPLTEDDLWQKTTFEGRWSFAEGDLWRKTTFDGRQLMMEDVFWWKTTFDGRQLLMEDDFWWKTTYDGRRLMMEDDLWWKTTYDGRQLMMEDN